MAIPTQCQTPGVIYTMAINEMRVSITANLRSPLMLSAEEAKLLEANVHNALELVLAPYFKARS